MSEQVIIIETGYKRGSANYHIEPTEPMPQNEARAEFEAIRTGTSDRLPAVDGSMIVELSDAQFLRVRSRLGATVLDRVTLGSVTYQQG